MSNAKPRAACSCLSSFIWIELELKLRPTSSRDLSSEIEICLCPPLLCSPFFLFQVSISVSPSWPLTGRLARGPRALSLASLAQRVDDKDHALSCHQVPLHHRAQASPSAPASSAAHSRQLARPLASQPSPTGSPSCPSELYLNWRRDWAPKRAGQCAGTLVWWPSPLAQYVNCALVAHSQALAPQPSTLKGRPLASRAPPAATLSPFQGCTATQEAQPPPARTSQRARPPILLANGPDETNSGRPRQPLGAALARRLS